MKALIVLSVVVLVVVAIIYIPALVFWGINQLFNYQIEFTFMNWLAAWVLIIIVEGGSASKKG